MAKNTLPFTIDEEFHRLCRGLTADELRQLQANIEQDGKFLDPLIVWQEKKLLVDGHSRHEVWESLPDDTPVEPPTIEYISFPSREAAMNWMIEHQVGRRNLDPRELTYLIGKKYNLAKRRPGRPKKEPSEKRSHGDYISDDSDDESTEGRTAEQVAAEYHVSPATVVRAGKRAESLDAIADQFPDVVQKINSGQIRVADDDLLTVSKMTAESMEQSIENWEQGRTFDDDGVEDEEPPKKAHPAVKYLEMAHKALGSLQGHVANGFRELGESAPPLPENAYKGIHGAIERGLRIAEDME